MPSDYKEKLEKKMDKNIKVFTDKHKSGDTISDTAYKAFGFEQGFNSLMEQTIKLAEKLDRIKYGMTGNRLKNREEMMAISDEALASFNSWLEGK